MSEEERLAWLKANKPLVGVGRMGHDCGVQGLEAHGLAASWGPAGVGGMVVSVAPSAPLAPTTHHPAVLPHTQDNASKPQKAKWNYLQKYWHKGAFFQDNAGEHVCVGG
jgi:hypothetical protein